MYVCMCIMPIAYDMYARSWFGRPDSSLCQNMSTHKDEMEIREREKPRVIQDSAVLSADAECVLQNILRSSNLCGCLGESDMASAAQLQYPPFFNS